MQMYAIFEAKGKQFRATPDLKLRIPSLSAEPGDRVTFDNVLLAQQSADADVLIGRPALEGASVAVEVLRHGKGEKIIVYKMKRRKGYRKKQGHRQKFTEVRVVDIAFGSGKSAKPEAAAKSTTAVKAKSADKAKTAEKAKPVSEPKAKKAPKKAEKTATPAATAIDATPTAKELAEEAGIDLASVEGTGKDGRILKSDVQAVIKTQEGK